MNLEELIEKAKDIKIVFFDIDDTLRVKTTGYMPESIKEVFSKLKEKGILTGIASGRCYFGVVPEIKELEPDYFVTINGAHVQDRNHNVIYKNPLPTEMVEEIISWANDEKINYSFVANENVIVNDWDKLAEDAIGPIYGRLAEDKDYYKKDDIYQMLTITERDVDDTLPENLKDKIRLVRWHEYSSDIVRFSGSKAYGVSKVLEKLGLTEDNLLVFGDELNDREIFDYAGLSVAMGVSHPEIKEKASLITDTVEQDGIYKALEKLEII
ncbi:Cof-type HAD-IIB family hydrolase [Floricoccus penangensis]|uniref:Cof-type HAD-IIB family hydrolase n=1 Tax=Floricoccus penangensis TaxID=1859475 RepID=UPI00203FB095|nr:Cof-type HAD-IIB family hydrolase [Floricoccus penangensis]